MITEKKSGCFDYDEAMIFFVYLIIARIVPE